MKYIPQTIIAIPNPETRDFVMDTLDPQGGIYWHARFWAGGPDYTDFDELRKLWVF